jgi:hypothetical protein
LCPVCFEYSAGLPVAHVRDYPEHMVGKFHKEQQNVPLPGIIVRNKNPELI